jgi:hypothetical protein
VYVSNLSLSSLRPRASQQVDISRKADKAVTALPWPSDIEHVPSRDRGHDLAAQLTYGVAGNPINDQQRLGNFVIRKLKGRATQDFLDITWF